MHYLYRPIDNGVATGAAAEYDWIWEQGEKLANAAEHELERLMADDDSVEEALSQNADIVRVQLEVLRQHPERAVAVAEFLRHTVREYLRPIAYQHAERAL
jgi:hypothetical protein